MLHTLRAMETILVDIILATNKDSELFFEVACKLSDVRISIMYWEGRARHEKLTKVGN